MQILQTFEDLFQNYLYFSQWKGVILLSNEVLEVKLHQIQAEVNGRRFRRLTESSHLLFVNYFIDVQDVNVIELLQKLDLPQSCDRKSVLVVFVLEEVLHLLQRVLFLVQFVFGSINRTIGSVTDFVFQFVFIVKKFARPLSHLYCVRIRIRLLKEHPLYLNLFIIIGVNQINKIKTKPHIDLSEFSIWSKKLFLSYDDGILLIYKFGK